MSDQGANGSGYQCNYVRNMYLEKRDSDLDFCDVFKIDKVDLRVHSFLLDDWYNQYLIVLILDNNTSKKYSFENGELREYKEQEFNKNNPKKDLGGHIYSQIVDNAYNTPTMFQVVCGCCELDTQQK